MFLAGLIVGILVSNLVTIIVLALCFAAKGDDEE